MYYARFALLGLWVVWASASAQPFPSKQVRLVTPFPPGGSADVIARIAGQRLGEIFGQPVLVENRPGAGGVVGSDYVAKQPPDGHTLLLVTGAYPVSAVMMKALPFDPLNDIAMVSLLTSYPFVISVAPGSPFKSLGELIAYAKAHPGKLNYPSGGIGTVHHLSGEVVHGADAAGRIVQFPRMGFGVRDELAQRLERRARRHADDEGIRGEERHHGNVVQRIERQRLHHHRRHRVGARHQEQGMAVGRLLCDVVAADHAARAGAVFH